MGRRRAPPALKNLNWNARRIDHVDLILLVMEGVTWRQQLDPLADQAIVYAIEGGRQKEMLLKGLRGY